MSTYMIYDGDGDAITVDAQEGAIKQMAQEIADQRGEDVWYCDMYGHVHTAHKCDRR